MTDKMSTAEETKPETGTDVAIAATAEVAVRDMAKAQPTLAPVFETLLEQIKNESEAPPVGIDAAQRVREAFQLTIHQVQGIVADARARVEALEDEAKRFCDVMEQSGEILCERIETETLRALQVEALMSNSRRLMGVVTAEGEADKK